MRIFMLIAMAAALILYGCSSPVPTEKEGEELLTGFIKAKYELDQKDMSINDVSELYPVIAERVKPYLTEQEHANFVKNREAGTTIDVARDKQTIKIKELKISKIEPSADHKSLNVDYTLSFVGTNTENGTSIEHQATGQVTLVKENDSWKIERNWNSISYRNGVLN
ncbi:hypothetical protein [Brevibacillus borstelensis]|uniref:hypothetical protein n=1 Tax=Brevibacillus borstelensis TaxID=45462 RepID=UPI0004683190|nr:hypothetical protein [Brevibacillus borstelensis]